ncbi:hypothetical protein [Corynebacterium diphtheriae]|nr:hypothetical protein [Corynebacterium diphtheriae]
MVLALIAGGALLLRSRKES